MRKRAAERLIAGKIDLLLLAALDRKLGHEHGERNMSLAGLLHPDIPFEEWRSSHAHNQLSQ